MIREAEYANRRQRFADSLDANSVALLFSAEKKIRSHDTEYPYRQESNFYYLCGFKEDSAALLFVKKKRKTKCYLFVHKKDPKEELWNGERLGVEAAKKHFCVDNVFLYDALSKRVSSACRAAKVLYYDFGLAYTKVKLLKRYAKGVATLKDLAPMVQRMRLIKSQSEIALIKKALSITKEAHHRVMQNIQNMEYEYEVAAELAYVFAKRGAQSDAYTSIVASANHANTLHYIKNDAPLQRDALLLIDAGCEYDYYASDITRTIAASASFTKAQRSVYEAVLAVEKEIITLIRPNVLRSDLQKRAERRLCEAMVDLGILKGSVTKLLKKGAHKRYFPHGIGHWMGIDVHDPAPYRDEDGKEIPLAAGMVLTIEPGIYIDKDDKSVPKRYRGIGVRIEDDILVTEDGYENLSGDIVKEIADITALSLC